MNNRIQIENFKCFSRLTEIRLGKITACVGMNSVGKSSVIQTMLLLRQIYDAAYLYRDTQIKDFTIELNEIYGLQLGDAEHIKSSAFAEDILIGADRFLFKMQSGADQPLRLLTRCDYTLKELQDAEGIFHKSFYYLNAERLGPRNYQSISSDKQGCGVHGENTFHFISEKGNQKIDGCKTFPFDENKRVNAVNKQIEYWMDYIVPGIELSISELNDLRISKLSVNQQIFDTGFLSPYNFGFGISYVLPVVATGIMAERGSCFIVENPEAHLHPCGQSRIGYFLAVIAMSGVQVVVETHSEHVINGIRIAALKNGLKPDDISLNNFSVHSKTGEHQVEHIELNDRMDIKCWPEGFFDQEEKDLRTLRELRKHT